MVGPFLLLLGKPELRLDDGCIPFVAERRFQLLAYLALSGDWVERDRLAGLFWPDLGNAAARRNLRKIVYRARESPWLRDLETQGEALRWRIANDVARFREAVAKGRTAEAIELYRGPLLAGLDDPRLGAFSAWVSADRAQLQALWYDAALSHVPALSSPQERTTLAALLLQTDPLDERALLAFIDAARAAGQVAEARHQCRAYVHRLAEELGLEPSVRVRAAQQALSAVAGPSASAAPGASAAAATSASHAASGRTSDSFVGRRAELGELLALLARPECRLVTVFGPGGIGKSRLVREALPRIESTFGWPVHWIALEDLASATAGLGRIAQALQITVSDAGDPVARIARHAPAQQTLLALDNAEHLPDLPQVAQRLLAACPTLTLLVTSRVRLLIPDEWLLPLAGLAVPDDESRDLEAAAAFDAIAMFALRAHAAQPAFDLGANLPAVIDIVSLVDGLPLAIELAAGWSRLLPPAEVLRDLRSSLDVLQADRDHSPTLARPEHRSVRATFDRSWQMLAPAERATLAAASVFRGGFTRDAALAVLGAPLPVLASLADRSLLSVDPGGRFHLHPLLAVFAADQLAAMPAAAAVAERHARYWSGWLDSVDRRYPRDSTARVAAVRTEYANCEAAWRYAVRQSRPDLALPMVSELLTYFTARGRSVEGCALLSEALTGPTVDRTARQLRLQLLLALAHMHLHRGQMQHAESLSQAALALARELRGQQEQLRAHIMLGLCLQQRGLATAALPHLERALKAARQLGDRDRIANALYNVALAERDRGHYGRSFALVEQAQALWRETGNDDGQACALVASGTLLRIGGQHEPSRKVLDEALQLAQSHGLAGRKRHVSMALGRTLTALGSLTEARRCLQQCVSECEEAGQIPLGTLARIALARLCLQERRSGDLLRACREAFNAARSNGLDGMAMAALAVFAEWCAQRGEADAALRLTHLLLCSESLDQETRDTVQRCADALLAGQAGSGLDPSTDPSARPADLDLADAKALLETRAGAFDTASS